MGKRFGFLIVLVVVAMALGAPAALAAITVNSITPEYGVGGSSVTCTVAGDFWVNTLFIDALEPTFKLVNGGTTIDGTTNSWDASSASVTFSLPAAGPQGDYDLEAAQSHKLNFDLLYTKDLTTAASAFDVYVRPVISGINPTGAAVGSADLILTVTGSRFYTNGGNIFGYRSLVRFNGESVTTSFTSSSQLLATIPAAKLAALGTAQITVFNRPGIILVGGFSGVESNAVTFTISNPVPILGSVSPTSLWAGSVRTDVLLTVNGTNFMSGARIVINGGEKSGTTFVGATQLTVLLTPADMALPVPNLTVSVKNPPFPPGTSSAGALPIPLQPETTTPTVSIGGADDAWHNDPVALTFTAADSQSGIQKVQYMAPPAVAAWTDGTSYTVPTTSQGAITVSAQALDWCNKVGTAQATVNIDTTKPDTEARGNVSVKKGKKATLKYRIGEPAGLSPTADVVIKVKRGNGSTAKTITKNDVQVNKNLSVSFTCNLKKGSYTWYVYATDLAGNTQENVAKAKLTVK